ncbi:MAG: cytochrome c-type biogenesis CcmF C-terminal domain-containing protein [Microthrixaceae bacterium]
MCSTFNLTILGTFLTRSGVVESVRAFASGAVGPMLLGLFAVSVAVSLGLIAWRADMLRSVGRIRTPMSREGVPRNNVVFTALAFVVLLGTSSAAAGGAQRRPHHRRGALLQPHDDAARLRALTLMAVAPVMPWRRAPADSLKQRLFWPAWFAVAVMLVAALAGAGGGLRCSRSGSRRSPVVPRSASSGAVRRQGWRGLVGRTNGGMIVHLGVVVVAVAFAASTTYMQTVEVDLARGEEVSVAGHTVEFMDTRTVMERALTIAARVRVDGDRIFEPRLNRYRATGMVIGTPSVRVGPFEDVYLALTSSPEASTSPGDNTPVDEVTLRVVVQPLVSWLWVGGIVMVLGTALALVPAGRRQQEVDRGDTAAGERAADEAEVTS